MTNKTISLSLKYIKEEEEERIITTAKVIIRSGTDLTVTTDGHNLEVDLGMNKIIGNRIIEQDHNMQVIREMALEGEVLGQDKIIEV